MAVAAAGYYLAERPVAAPEDERTRDFLERIANEVREVRPPA
jgi:hypothetical protein